ncbi:MAG TPA: hypothetical protein VNJ08_11415 [Bacteriovoracaceae bacterium]|nr:hypothetical protein [Bacteriovoracaceae bacterium]
MILSISLLLLGLLKSHDQTSLHPFRQGQRSIKIQKFTEVKNNLTIRDQELLELWESVLTGRSAPLARWMKDTYATLGLQHLFTPSGFHLTAVLSPFLKFTSSAKVYLVILAIVGGLLFFVPGMGALKRMVLIKGAQKLTNARLGFVIALILDVLWGTFQDAPLSFSYSFLFLGIIYSGARGAGLIFWFFICQLILAHFQGNLISPLLLLWSPLLNLAFSLIMPLLFILAIPLWNWQLHSGLFLLSTVQKLIMVAAESLKYVPAWEIHTGILIMVFLFLFRKWKCLILALFILSNSLDIDMTRIPSAATYEFKPQGALVKTKADVFYFTDGKCKLSLVQGFWWERCSPRAPKRTRRSTQIKRIS